jgi:hypothetical protein
MGHDSATCLSCRAFRPCEVLAREASAVLSCQWCLNGECPRHPRTGNEEPATPPAAECGETWYGENGGIETCVLQPKHAESHSYNYDHADVRGWKARIAALEAELREARERATPPSLIEMHERYASLVDQANDRVIAAEARADAARELLGEARAVLEAFANQRSIIRHGENAIVARDLVRRIGEATKVVG